MPHGVTCGYETQHHTPGMTLTSMSPGIKSENRRMCGEEQNWRFIDNYTSPPGMNVLRCHYTDHKCFPGRGSDAEVVETSNCPTTFKETITGQRHPSSFRPVSNLTQLSKVIEKVVALRIMTHVSDQQMVECFQSAYRKKTFDRNCASVCYKCGENSNGEKTRNHLASRLFQFRLRYDQP